MSTVAADFATSTGTVKPLHGVNNGPVGFGSMLDNRHRYRELGVPHVRLHETNWPHPRKVDVPQVFPDFLGFAPDGALRYADAARPVVEDAEGGSVNGVAVDPDGSVYVLVSGGLVARGERAQGTGARIVKYGPDGRELWRYANVHCGFAWTSGPPRPA